MAMAAASPPIPDPGTLRPAAAPERVDQRRCLVTRESRPKTALIRFAIAPDGTVVPDIEQRLPGRGLWITAQRDIVDTAVARGHFQRVVASGRRQGRFPDVDQVVVPADLADRIAERLVRRCQDLIGLARRAGEAVAGFEKVRAWLKADRVGVILTAADGAPDGRRKLAALAATRPKIDLLTGAELAAAFGRDHAVHGAVAPGRLARILVAEAQRLSGFRRADRNRGEDGKVETK